MIPDVKTAISIGSDVEILKAAMGVIALLLTFVGYVPYIRDTLKGKTHPHVYSWFLWSFIALLTFALQVTNGGGLGSFVTLAAGIVCMVICLLAFPNGKKDIHKVDTVFLIAAFVALGLWLLADAPVLSVILLSTIEMLGFVPTIRKSWNKPFSETLLSYVANTVRFALAIVALNRYSVVTTLFPITWLLANGLFAVLLSVRRKAVGLDPEGVLSRTLAVARK